MPNLIIVSRDASTYAKLINQAKLPQLNLLFANQGLPKFYDYSRVDIVLGDPDLTVQIIEECSAVRWVQSTWAGNAALFAAGNRNYQLCGVKGVFQQAMREYVFAYLLHFSRNITGFDQAQKAKKWISLPYHSLAGKTLGIMGVGNIGKAVAQTAKHFSMRTWGFTRSSRDCSFIDSYFGSDDLQAFASELDYLVCLLPHSPATTGLIDQQFLAYLPKRSVLINAGRGTTIEEPALIEALQNKRLHAAVLDVFEQEPLPRTHRFWELDNLYVTQHTAAESVPNDIFLLFKDNYQRHIAGQPLKNVLDFAKGY